MPGSWLVNGAPMGSPSTFRPEDRPSNYGYIQQAHSYLEAVPCHRSCLLGSWLLMVVELLVELNCAGVAVVVAVVVDCLLVVGGCLLLLLVAL